MIDTNVTGTTYLLQRVAGPITGSNAWLPGVHDGTKAYLDSFSYALHEERRDTDATVLMRGATEAELFGRAPMGDTEVGQADKDDAEVARDGRDAMLPGSGHVVPGWHNKLRAAMSHRPPDAVPAKLHRGMAEPDRDGGSERIARAKRRFRSIRGWTSRSILRHPELVPNP